MAPVDQFTLGWIIQIDIVYRFGLLVMTIPRVEIMVIEQNPAVGTKPLGDTFKHLFDIQQVLGNVVQHDHVEIILGGNIFESAGDKFDMRYLPHDIVGRPPKPLPAARSQIFASIIGKVDFGV